MLFLKQNNGNIHIFVFNKEKSVFFIVYKVIKLIVQDKYTNCTRVYKLVFLTVFE